MQVTLLHHTPLTYCDLAISKCWDKPYDPTNVNTAKIDRIANKFKHESTIEHINYNFDIQDVSRALLQEHARHRIGSFSVKSTRYTLGELKSELPFLNGSSLSDQWPDLDWHTPDAEQRASKYIKFTGNTPTDIASLQALDNLADLVRLSIANDKSKYALPESYLTEYSWTINARALRNFLELRINHKHALWEIAHLAENIALSLPNDHKFLYKSTIDEFASQEFKEVFSESMI